MNAARHHVQVSAAHPSVFWGCLFPCVSVCRRSSEEAMQLLHLLWQSSGASRRLLLGLLIIPRA